MTIKELYNKQMEHNKAFQEEIKKIKSMSETFSDAEIKKQILEKTKEFNVLSKSIGKEIVDALNAFRKEKNYNTVAIDNPVFMALLQAAQVFGDSIPNALIDTAVFKLKNEQGTLMAIKTLLQKYNIPHHVGGALNELLIENILIDGAISEANKCGESQPVELVRVMQVSNAIERLEGYRIPEYQTSVPEIKFYI